jgi:hypothetical protein
MLMIIGGRRSSCIESAWHILKETVVPKEAGPGVVVIDGALWESFLERFETCRGKSTVIVEHAYFAFDYRARDKVTRNNCIAVLSYKHYGIDTLILLTREVGMINKQLRDQADVKFDFS